MKNIVFLLFLFLLAECLTAQATLPPEMVFVKGGTFTMGCTGEQQPDCQGYESPTRKVRISAFEIGKYEVTQGQWQALMGNNPSGFGSCGADCPVEKVSFYDCISFCNRLSQQQNLIPCYYFDKWYSQPFDSLIGNVNIFNFIYFYIKPDANGYRLPTETEWEYAARGGNQSSVQTKYSGSNLVSAVAWYSINSNNKTHAIGLLQSNALGTFDMSGNVQEWCQDVFEYYGNPPDCNAVFYLYPRPSSRGGQYPLGDIYTRTSARGYAYGYDFRDKDVGFRLARIP